MTTPIEKRIRRSGFFVGLGMVVVLFSQSWPHPLSFMAFLAVGCPLILIGILIYLWALATKDGETRTNPILLLILLPLVFTSCSNDDELIRRIAERKGPDTKSSELPAFDPMTATARVFGKVMVEGKVEIPKLTIGQDNFCKMNAHEIFRKGALVSESGGLRNAILYVRSGYEGRTYEVPPESIVLDQQLCVYVPHALTLMKGQKLRILNSDPTFHNVHAYSDGGTVFNIAQAKKGAEDVQTFSHTGMPIRIGCDLHSWMASYVGVFEHPFHTTTGETGTFELRLPPGKYELAAWHKKLGEQSSSFEVAAGSSHEVNFTFSAAAVK
jgi:plastocyanin